MQNKDQKQDTGQTVRYNFSDNYLRKQDRKIVAGVITAVLLMFGAVIMFSYYLTH